MITLNIHLANIYLDFSNIIFSIFDADFSQIRDRITDTECVIALCSYHHFKQLFLLWSFSPCIHVAITYILHMD